MPTVEIINQFQAIANNSKRKDQQMMAERNDDNEKSANEKQQKKTHEREERRVLTQPKEEEPLGEIESSGRLLPESLQSWNTACANTPPEDSYQDLTAY